MMAIFFKKKLINYLILIVMIGVTTLIYSKYDTDWQKMSQVPDRSIATIYINRQPLKVEVVNTEASREQGLSGRQAIGHDGMLFVYPSPNLAGFWMKDMLFNLDLVWIRSNQVIAVMPNVPRPLSSRQKLPVYHIQEPINAVLELPSGKAHELKIQKGSLVHFE